MYWCRAPRFIFCSSCQCVSPNPNSVSDCRLIYPFHKSWTLRCLWFEGSPVMAIDPLQFACFLEPLLLQEVTMISKRVSVEQVFNGILYPTSFCKSVRGSYQIMPTGMMTE